MTTIATLRANIRKAITDVFSAPAVITALGGKIPNIYEGKAPEAWFAMNLPGNEGVIFSYIANVLKDRGPLSRRDRQRMYYRFSIACCSGNWAEPVGALYTAADVNEYLLGSPSLPDTTPNLRNALIGNIYGDDVYIRFVDQKAVMAPNSTLQGGRSALISTWETFPEVPM